ncbi:MAG: hypothetical protein GX619_06185 [Bacteroidales bacterium]|jgi:hypothetical protein|nr:hypothetical protein [Bacteroidales bacterium]
MKTSTNILLIYVALILAFILMLFILAKNKANEIEANKDGTVVTTIPIPSEASINVVVVDSFCVCQINLSDSAYITWTHPDDSLDYGDLFKISHDTLYVIKSPNREPEDLVVHCPAIKTVVARHYSTVTLAPTPLDSLTIVADNGEVRLWEYIAEGVENKEVLDLTVLADSGMVLVNTAFKSLNATMNGGKLVAQQAIGQSVNLNLRNNATVSLANSPASMTVKTDQTSKVVIDD